MEAGRVSKRRRATATVEEHSGGTDDSQEAKKVITLENGSDAPAALMASRKQRKTGKARREHPNECNNE